MSLGTLAQYTGSTDTYAFMAEAPTLNTVDFLDGPPGISHASTNPISNLKPTLYEMQYYNYYAAAMYCQYQLDDLSCDYCTKFKKDVYDHTVLTSNVHDTAALVAVSKTRQEIIVVYRGTMNLWDVILDIAAISVTYPNLAQGIKLHGGFNVATMSHYNEVVTNIGYLRLCFPSYKIVLPWVNLWHTQFFFLALNQFPGAPYELYTYGELRSGNMACADYAQRIKTARVVARADIFAHIVPTSFLGTKLLGGYYTHCQPEFCINGENNQTYCDLFGDFKHWFTNIKHRKSVPINKIVP